MLLKLRDLLAKPFPLLDDYRSKIFLVSFCGIFATFFIYYYNPFSLNQISYSTAVGRFLSIWTAGIIGALILSFTQFFLRPALKLETFTVGSFIVWVLFEFVCLCVGFYLLFGESHVPFVTEFSIIVGYTFSVGLLPYSLACLIIAVVTLSRTSGSKSTQKSNKLCFRDENDKIMLALIPGQVLYLKSEDNYTSIYYLKNDQVKKELIRNNLKKLEEQLEDPNLIRVHRSYMVNMSNITAIQRSKRGYELTMESLPDIFLSVSETYKQSFELLMQSQPPATPIHPK